MAKKKKNILDGMTIKYKILGSEPKEAYPVLYILMRSDLNSLNAGKAMAQAGHAANAMVHEIRRSGAVPSKYITNLLNKWEGSTTQGFGTCLVLDCHNQQIMVEVLRALRSVVESRGAKHGEVVSGILNDPTYPVRDGDVTHFISVNTCAYAFFDKNDEALQHQLSDLDLYK